MQNKKTKGLFKRLWWVLTVNLKISHRQTQYFIFTLVIYMTAIIWTTIQAYARLAYSRSDERPPVIIETRNPSK
jgi:hypothetical protein